MGRGPDDPAMTITEARLWLQRIRQQVRAAERALITRSESNLLAAVQDISGCAAQIEQAIADDYGVKGLT